MFRLLHHIGCMSMQFLLVCRVIYAEIKGTKVKSYLEMADKIYEKLLQNVKPKYSTQDIFYTIIRELRKIIKGSSIKFKHSTNISDIYSSDLKYALYDLSLIPCLKKKDEFILWLATFIETITINMNAKNNDEKNKYDLTSIELYKNELEGKSPIYSSCAAIEDYFNRKK